MSDRYILDATGQPVPEPDLMKWALWMETHERHVAETTIGASRVSTVFLGLDHSFSCLGPEMERIPILFETMVFGGPLDEYQERYATRAEAEAGHAAAVAAVQAAVTAAQTRKEA